MPLSNEAIFTAAEVSEVNTLVTSILDSLRDFVNLVKGVAVAPAVFLQIPIRQEQLQNLIDSYSVIYDLLPRAVFEAHMDAMIQLRDELDTAEGRATQVSAGWDPMQSTMPRPLRWERGPNNGALRLDIPRELVETLIDDVGLTNQEISQLLGKL